MRDLYDLHWYGSRAMDEALVRRLFVLKVRNLSRPWLRTKKGRRRGKAGCGGTDDLATEPLEAETRMDLALGGPTDGDRVPQDLQLC